MAKEAAVDPWDQTYVVETQENGEWKEDIYYGLSHLREQVESNFGRSSEPEKFYEDILTPIAQRLLNIRIRVATDEDLEKFKDVAEIKKKTQQWFDWAEDEEKRKNHLATEITYHIQQHVKSKDDLVRFLAQTGMNTAQLRAIARRGAQSKDKFPGEYSISLDDNFLDFYSKYVAEKSTGKSATTAEKVESNFYDGVI